MQIEEKVIELTGGRTRVQIRGEGPPFIWTHSMLHAIDVEDQTPIGPMLAGIEGRTVIRYDTRGHGASEPGRDDEAHRTEALGAELLELAGALGIDRFAAGGASMGSATTMHAAVTAPERIERLVILIPPTAWETRPEQQALYRGTRDIIAEGGKMMFMMMFQQAMQLRPLVPGFEPARDALLETLRAWDADGLGRVFGGNALSDMPDGEAIEKIDVPSMVVAVEGDRSHPVSSADRLQAYLRTDDRVTLPTLDADAIATRVAAFLR